MTLPTWSRVTRRSSASSGALVSKPTMSSWPRRCSSLRPSRVDETHACAGFSDAVGLGERPDPVGLALGLGPVDGVALDDGLVLDDVAKAVEDSDVEGAGDGGAPEQPARATARSPHVTASRRQP